MARVESILIDEKGKIELVLVRLEDWIDRLEKIERKLRGRLKQETQSSI